MSDSSVKAEVEDVLSSIKRLVDEEGRKLPNANSAAVSPKPARLVLSESLRVKETASQSELDGLKALALDFAVDAFVMKEAEISHGAPANKKVEPMLLTPADRVFPDAPAAAEGKDETARSKDLAGSLSAKIEALEAAIARTEDQWEPDGNSADAYSGTHTRRMKWDSESGFVPPERKEPLQNSSGTPAPERESATGPVTLVHEHIPAEQGTDARAEADTASATMDEEALRDLVAEIVREELQGALGERITRNIRKLVRREINRALAAQDLT